MQRLIRLIFFLCVCSKGFCQNGSILILDDVTKKPVQFCSLVNLTGKEVRDANAEGLSHLPFKIGDSIQISCIGFVSAKVKASHPNDAFYLEKKILALPEVVIMNVPPLHIGTIDSKSVSSSYATMILKVTVPKDYNKYQVTQVAFRCHDTSGSLFRLHLYKEDSLGMPRDEMLFKEMISSEASFKKGVVTFDLRNEQIADTVRSFFVGVEFLKTEFRKNALNFGIDNALKQTKSSSDFVTLNSQKNGYYYVFYEKGTEIYKAPYQLRTDWGNPINLIADVVINRIL